MKSYGLKMSEYFFDSYAIIESILGNENYVKYKDVRIVTNVLNLMEVYYFFLRKFDKKTADALIEKLDVELINVIRLGIALKATNFRFERKRQKLSYADCLGYEMAREFNLKFLTGDKEFENLENVEFVK